VITVSHFALSGYASGFLNLETDKCLDIVICLLPCNSLDVLLNVYICICTYHIVMYIAVVLYY